MMSLAETRVLFVATAGPRRGNGQFAQYVSIARALGIRPLVAVPGTRSAAEFALTLGVDVIPEATPAVIDALQADVVVVDDAIAAQVGGWIIAAQRSGRAGGDLGGPRPRDAEAVRRAQRRHLFG